MHLGRWSIVSIAVIIVLLVAIAVLWVLATDPIVPVERAGVAWSGFTLGYTAPPYDTVFNAVEGTFCPPQGDAPALVVGNVTVSFTWASASGQPVSNFNIFASDYPGGPSEGTYVYFVNNSSHGSFNSESTSITSSLCDYPLMIGAGVPVGDSVSVVIETVYTHNTTVPML